MTVKKSQPPTLHTRISRNQQRDINDIKDSTGKSAGDIMREALTQYIENRKISNDLSFITARLDIIERNHKENHEKITNNLTALSDLLQDLLHGEK